MEHGKHKGKMPNKHEGAGGDHSKENMAERMKMMKGNPMMKKMMEEKDHAKGTGKKAKKRS